MRNKSFLVLFFKKEQNLLFLKKKKQKDFYVLCCFLVVGLLISPPGVGQEPPATVSTVVARASDWQDAVQAVATLRAVHGADLAAEVSGVIDEVKFESGADVEKGAVLLKLRPNDDAARLAELQAAADLAAQNLARDAKQFEAQAVSQATMDADHSHLLAAKAQVAQLQALMAEKVVRAPFAGRLGLRLVEQGQYLAAGATVVTLQALDPLFADFYLPQQALAKLHAGDHAEIRVDTYPGRVFAARITAISPKLDSATRMISLRATLANADHALLPGMFANVSVEVGRSKKYITLPNAAIVYNPYGSLVYVLDRGKPATVHQVLVTTGPARGDQVAVTAGLTEGDVVVTAGQLKLHPGSTVTVNNTVQPSDNPQPHPAEE